MRRTFNPFDPTQVDANGLVLAITIPDTTPHTPQMPPSIADIIHTLSLRSIESVTQLAATRLPDEVKTLGQQFLTEATLLFQEQLKPFTTPPNDFFIAPCKDVCLKDGLRNHPLSHFFNWHTSSDNGNHYLVRTEQTEEGSYVFAKLNQPSHPELSLDFPATPENINRLTHYSAAYHRHHRCSFFMFPSGDQICVYFQKREYNSQIQLVDAIMSFIEHLYRAHQTIAIANALASLKSWEHQFAQKNSCLLNKENITLPNSRQPIARPSSIIEKYWRNPDNSTLNFFKSVNPFFRYRNICAHIQSVVAHITLTNPFTSTLIMTFIKQNQLFDSNKGLSDIELLKTLPNKLADLLNHLRKEYLSLKDNPDHDPTIIKNTEIDILFLSLTFEMLLPFFSMIDSKKRSNLMTLPFLQDLSKFIEKVIDPKSNRIEAWLTFIENEESRKNLYLKNISLQQEEKFTSTQGTTTASQAIMRHDTASASSSTLPPITTSDSIIELIDLFLCLHNVQTPNEIFTLSTTQRPQDLLPDALSLLTGGKPLAITASSSSTASTSTPLPRLMGFFGRSSVKALPSTGPDRLLTLTASASQANDDDDDEQVDTQGTSDLQQLVQRMIDYAKRHDTIAGKLAHLGSHHVKPVKTWIAKIEEQQRKNPNQALDKDKVATSLIDLINSLKEPLKPKGELYNILLEFERVLGIRLEALHAETTLPALGYK